MSMKIGVSDLCYTKLLTDDVTGVTYGTIAKIKGTNTIDVKPGADTGTFYADNGPFEAGTTLGEIGVDLEVASLSPEVEADLLGHTCAAGIITYNASDTPPYVAIGFVSLKSNGKKRYVWLLKGRFQEMDDSNKTKADKVDLQSTKISGKFVIRQNDGAWKKVADEEGTGFIATTATNWFTLDTIKVTTP